jgi:hypothetical protein
MNPLLDNEQIKDAKDTAAVAATTFETIGRNHAPYDMIISTAAARASVLFFNALGHELKEHSLPLAMLAWDAANSMRRITEEEKECA